MEPLHLLVGHRPTVWLKSAQAKPAAQRLIELHQMQGFQFANHSANGCAGHAEEFVGHQL